MTDVDSPDASQSVNSPPLVTSDAGGWLSWTAALLVCVAALSLAGVYLPAVAKKLGLFAIAFGLVTGWIASRLSAVFDIRKLARGASVLIVCVVIVAGLVGMTAESFRVWRNGNRQLPLMDPSTSLALRMLDSQKPSDDPKTKEIAEEMRQSIGRSIESRRELARERESFSGYLRYRISPLGPAIQPFAAVVWVFEIALGSLAGTWLFRRLTRLDADRHAAKLDP